MSCVDVRDQLAEFAVGVLSEKDQVAVGRHLQWCAGCRKEAAELGQAASTFAFALAPEPLPDGLEDRVVAEVRGVASRPRNRRRARTLIAASLAAAIAVTGLGWGAVMAGRAERFANRAALAERERRDALSKFREILRSLPFTPRAEETHLGQLIPTPSIPTGGGLALQLVSPTRLDFVFVSVSGLPRNPTFRPYRVVLRDQVGAVLRVGRIEQLDADGGGEVFRQFTNTDLTGFVTVLVVDASGRVVLRGTVDQKAPA